MKRLGLLIVGFIFLFVGIGFAAPDFAKFSTLKTDDKLLKGTSSMKSTVTTTIMKVEKSAARIQAKGPALKSGGVLAGYKINAASQARTAVQGVKSQNVPVAARSTGALQKAGLAVALPTNNAPAKNLKVPAVQKSAGSLAMPKIGGGTKIGGGIGQTGFGK